MYYYNFEMIKLNHKYGTKGKMKSNLKSVLYSTALGQHNHCKIV